MALIMPQLGFALLAALGLQEFIHSVERKELGFKKFKKVLYTTGGLILLSVLILFASDFKSDNDVRIKDEFVSKITRGMGQGKQPTAEMQQQAIQTVNTWMSALREDRKSIVEKDLLRSFVYVILAATLCWFYFKGKFSHALRKLPKEGDFRVQPEFGGKITPYTGTSSTFTLQ